MAIRNGFTIYDTHSGAFDIRITSMPTPLPEVKEIRDGVPHQNGDYDFTFMNGSPRFNNRKITANCFIIVEHGKSMTDTQDEIVEWLYARPFSELRLDHQDGRYYIAKCTDINFEAPDYIKRRLDFTIEFDAKPYAIRLIDNKEAL